jgi:hypothetical protein
MARLGDAMKYKLLALDVDGTLIGHDGIVSGDIVNAVAEAQRAGLLVCLATGRCRAETVPIWRQLRLAKPYQPLVLVGGAMVSEPDTGRTLYHRPIPPELAGRLADALAQAGYCAMALVDVWRHGIDYLLVERGDAVAAQELWLSKTGAKVRRVPSLFGDSPRVLRISAVVERGPGKVLAEQLRNQFDRQLNVHSILAPNYGVTVVEAFAAGVDKFSGIQYVAQSRSIGPGAIVAVGDDVNDLAMIRGAGLGVAMPQAPQELREVARRVADDGLAVFVRRLAAGEFEVSAKEPEPRPAVAAGDRDQCAEKLRESNANSR